MDFLTTEYVAEQAKLGEIPALECSLKHHQQGRDANWVELRDAMESRKFGIQGNSCACCAFQNKGNACPLQGERCSNSDCCGGHWAKVKETFYNLKADYSNANFKAFQEAEGKLCTYIEGVLEKKRAEQAEENKGNTCTGCKHDGGFSPCRSCNDFRNFESKESKPAEKLRHGDISISNFGNIGIIIGSGRSAIKHNSDGTSRCIGEQQNGRYDNHGGGKLGNAFELADDLALLAEDLDYTTIDGFVLELTCDRIVIGGRRFLFEQGKDFHQKLGQMVATARRKQGKKQENE